jgi:hypothetical protein
MESDTTSNRNLRKIVAHHFDIARKGKFTTDVVNRFQLVSDKIIVKNVANSYQLVAQHPD